MVCPSRTASNTKPDCVCVCVCVFTNNIFSHTQIARKSGPVNGKATAYVCQNRVCSLPITNAQALAERLEGKKGGGTGTGGGDVASLLRGEGKSSE